jgi:hypothetical protein
MKSALSIRVPLAIALVLLIFQFSPIAVPAQENSAMPPALAKALDEAVGLLENERYEDFLKNFAHPDDLTEMLKSGSIEELAAEFKGEKAEVLLDVLKSISDQSPDLRDNGTAAVFATKMNRPMMFLLLAGRWYLKN